MNHSAASSAAMFTITDRAAVTAPGSSETAANEIAANGV